MAIMQKGSRCPEDAYRQRASLLSFCVGNSIFLATKLSNRDGNESRRIVEESLKALQVDRLDLLHIHALTTEEDLSMIEAKGGPLDQIVKMRDQKMTRFIGITCHADPAVLR